jgi:hypothetical protein
MKMGTRTIVVGMERRGGDRFENYERDLISMI